MNKVKKTEQSKEIRTRGRKKGTPNKRTQTLFQKAQELGVDPFEILLLIAKGDWKALGYDSSEIQLLSKGIPYFVDRISLQMRQSAASDCCQYMLPKRKAIEMPITNPEDTSKEKVALMISWVKEIAED